jgi:predicted AlkP superfamily phosphohydrolase/phosphomutase
MTAFWHRRRPRVLFLGFDGVPHSAITALMDAGDLPNMRRLAHEGGLLQMDSVVPTISSVAWSSFMTGCNPGRHSIYGFIDRTVGTYDVFLPNARSMTAPTLWEHLSQAGKRVFVMGIPITYPPRKVNGILVSGFLATELDRATYPERVAADLKAMGYVIDVDAWKAREDRDAFMTDLENAFQKRWEVAREFLGREDWDFFAVHFMDMDRLQHFFWADWEDGAEPFASRFKQFYLLMDEIVGELSQLVDKRTSLVVMSDHGFCRLRQEVNLGLWLWRNGWLGFGGASPDTIANLDGSRTKVFSLIPGRLFVNLRGREPGGSVNPKDAGSVQAELIEALRALVHPESGEPVVERVYRREELYQGDYIAQAPDLVAVPRRGFDLKDGYNKPTVWTTSPINGMHTYDDAFLLTSFSLPRDTRPWVADVMPTILHRLDVPRPELIDGRSLLLARG